MQNSISRTLLLLACTAVMLFGPQSSVVSAPAGMISDLRVTNLSDKGFTVSWMTNVASTGRVSYGTTPALGSNRADDAGAGPYAHHVTLSGLTPGTTYYFDVISGGYTDNNGGAHYSVTTGPTLAIPGTDTVYGQVFRPDGVTPVAGVIVYVTVVDRNGSGSAGRSATLSALSDAAGYWFVNLASIRTVNAAAYFSYSPAGGDDLELSARHGPWGNAALTVDLGQSYVAGSYRAPTPPLILAPFGPSGTVTLDGAAVAAGTTVAAWCGGVQRATTAVFIQNGASRYALVVPGDDPATPSVREGCLPAETVTFRVGDYWSGQAVPWTSGGLALALTAVSAAPSAPVAPPVTAVNAGGGVQLRWPEDAANRSYEVWRSTTPYFTPGSAGTEVLANAAGDCVRSGGTFTCADPGATGSPDVNYFYLVRAGNGANAAADSTRVGEFDFALQPGN